MKNKTVIKNLTEMNRAVVKQLVGKSKSISALNSELEMQSAITKDLLKKVELLNKENETLTSLFHHAKMLANTTSQKRSKHLRLLAALQ